MDANKIKTKTNVSEDVTEFTQENCTPAPTTEPVPANDATAKEKVGVLTTVKNAIQSEKGQKVIKIGKIVVKGLVAVATFAGAYALGKRSAEGYADDSTEDDSTDPSEPEAKEPVYVYVNLDEATPDHEPEPEPVSDDAISE